MSHRGVGVIACHQPTLALFSKNSLYTHEKALLSRNRTTGSTTFLGLLPGWSYRASKTAAVLSRKGFTNVGVLYSGTDGWYRTHERPKVEEHH